MEIKINTKFTIGDKVYICYRSAFYNDEHLMYDEEPVTIKNILFV